MIKKLSEAAKVIGMATSFIGMGNSMYSQMIEENQKWEQRQHNWNAKYPEEPADYQEMLKLYDKMSLKISAFGFNPIRAMYTQDENWQVHWFTLKQICEDITQKELPDINPKDAIELGRTTIFSAEQWYRGCTEGKIPPDVEIYHFGEI